MKDEFYFKSVMPKVIFSMIFAFMAALTGSFDVLYMVLMVFMTPISMVVSYFKTHGKGRVEEEFYVANTRDGVQHRE